MDKKVLEGMKNSLRTERDKFTKVVKEIEEKGREKTYREGNVEGIAKRSIELTENIEEKLEWLEKNNHVINEDYLKVNLDEEEASNEGTEGPIVVTMAFDGEKVIEDINKVNNAVKKLGEEIGAAIYAVSEKRESNPLMVSGNIVCKNVAKGVGFKEREENGSGEVNVKSSIEEIREQLDVLKKEQSKYKDIDIDMKNHREQFNKISHEISGLLALYAVAEMREENKNFK